MLPPKLQKGDEIRVITPSRSISLLSDETVANAKAAIKDMGFSFSFGAHINESDEMTSSPIASRVADLHAAFSDKNVKAVLTVIGGYNVNQILDSLDFELIGKNPKILCGYSDITALQNAIYAKTGLVTYSGPHFSSFGMLKGIEYTRDMFKRCLESSGPFSVVASERWSDDQWYMNQENRNFIENPGYYVIKEGEAEGRIIGGNLCTFNLLQGTEYMPSLKDAILFVEDDAESKLQDFDRDLQSVMHLPDFQSVRGIVIGRFQKASGVDLDFLAKYLSDRLPDVPVIANADFGHTTPQMTYPIGGTARIKAGKDGATLEILGH